MLDSAIRLFGKQISPSVFDGGAPLVIQYDYLGASSERTEHEDTEKGTEEGKVTENTHENEEALLEEDDSADMETNTSHLAIRSENGETEETEEQFDDSSKEKTLKKPDKILPCPRCKSMETKFCYYNNYNANQPRYFCKACQRYWTSGGTMRNVPVGAGRRKNKNSTSTYRHITMSDPPIVKINGKVLSFGYDAPICGSIALHGNSNGFQKIEGQGISDDCSCVSSLTGSDSTEEGVKKRSSNLNGSPSCMPYFPVVPWPYCPPGFPVSIYHGPYWNYNTPCNWNTPWISQQSSSPSSISNSPTLGKHSRDNNMPETCNTDNKKDTIERHGSVLVPKTLRIDDPNDAAKSSIWATLGIKNETTSAMFKNFQSKGVEQTCLAERSSVLSANPAALSRSFNFHETV